MNKISYKYHLLTIGAFIVVSFVVQALNHFIINAAFYAKQTIIAPEPVLVGGIIAMVIQGALLSVLYARCEHRFAGIGGATNYSLLMGLFLVTYIAVVEPSKYLVVEPLQWFVTESVVGIFQFTVFGIILGLIYNKGERRMEVSTNK